MHQMHLLSIVLITVALVGHTTLASSPPTSPAKKRSKFSVPASFSIFGFGKKAPKSPKPDKYSGVEAPTSDSASAQGLSLKEYGLPAAARKIMLKIHEMCTTMPCKGVYRESGIKASVDSVIQFIKDHEWDTEDAMRDVPIPADAKIHDLAEGVKNYLLKKEVKDQFFVAGVNREGMLKAMADAVQSNTPDPIRDFLATQSEPLKASLAFILAETAHIIRKVPSSLMNVQNISRVWGTVLFPLASDDLKTIQKEAMEVPKHFENMISLYMVSKAAGFGLHKAQLKKQAEAMGITLSSPASSSPN